MSRAREIKWKDRLEERSNAVFMVRNILGCTCPEDIFDHYRVSHNISEAIPMVRLIMGNRLLIWIVDAAWVVEPGQILPRLLEQGLAERESRCLNRFRFVVVGASLSWEKEWAYLAEGLGPKVHLHVLQDIGDLINSGEVQGKGGGSP